MSSHVRMHIYLLWRSAAFCALFSIAAATIALLSKNTPASTGQRQLCVCVLVPFAVFTSMFYVLWFDALLAVSVAQAIACAAFALNLAQLSQTV